VAKLIPILTEKIQSGTELRELVAAGALANARTFGGEDYVGFHTMMALSPGYHMAQELPKEQQPLPVFKVLYRNTNRIQESGGGTREVLHPVTAASRPADVKPGEWLREAVHSKDAARADAAFAAVADTPEDALDALLQEVHDDTEVHRVVLPYRAWDLLGIIGRDQATTLLRQSVRYCVRAEQWRRNDPSALLPKMLEEYKLLGATPGTRSAEDKWVEELSLTIFKSTPEQAAAAAAAALAEGMMPDAIGEAISLAANQLILRDRAELLKVRSTGSQSAVFTAIPSVCTPAILQEHGEISRGSPGRGTPSLVSSSGPIRPHWIARTVAGISRLGSHCRWRVTWRE
jgi:hypothetical protein